MVSWSIHSALWAREMPLLAFVLLPEDEGVQDDLHRTRAGEHGQPVEHGKGQKTGCIAIRYGAAAVFDYVAPESEYGAWEPDSC